MRLHIDHVGVCHGEIRTKMNKLDEEKRKSDEKSKKRKKFDHDRIDGGEFKIIKKINLDSESSLITPLTNGTLSDKAIWYLRQYVDLVHSVAFNAMAASENFPIPMEINKTNKFIGCRDIALAIPGVVFNILRYNGCQFSEIRFCKKSVNIFEPIWYHMNLDKNANYLELYINEPMINDFCRKANNDAEFVHIEPNISKLISFNSNFNKMQKDMQRFMFAARKLIILCDHACQHIISELHNRHIPKAAKLHDPHFFLKHGTTLTSIFRIFRTTTKSSNCNNFVEPWMLETTNLITNQCNEHTNFLDKLIN